MKPCDMSNVRDHARRVGSNWFSEGSMRWFGSRIAQWGFATDDGTRVYFVSSERDTSPHPAWNGERRWSVRVADMTGSDRGCIDTVGEFGGHRTRRAASREAERLCREYDALAPKREALNANAPILAAAPDLLAALSELIFSIDNRFASVVRGTAPTRFEGTRYESALLQARAALAKARGKDPAPHA